MANLPRMGAGTLNRLSIRFYYTPALLRLSKIFLQDPRGPAQSELRQLRMSLAAYFYNGWSLPEEPSLHYRFAYEFRDLVLALESSGIRFLDMNSEEQSLYDALLEKYKKHFSRDTIGDAGVLALTGLLLFRHAYEIEPWPMLTALPEWFGYIYAQSAGATPFFHSKEQTEQYPRYIRQFIEQAAAIASDAKQRTHYSYYIDRLLIVPWPYHLYVFDDAFGDVMRQRKRLIEAALTLGQLTPSSPNEWGKPRAKETISLALMIYPTIDDDSNAYYVLPYIEGLAEKGFHITLYTSDEPKSEFGRYFASQAHELILLDQNIEPLAHTQARVRDAQHDIIIYGLDLAAVGGRPVLLAALRLARIQIALLGSPISPGLPNIDYFVTSKSTQPSDPQPHYCEKLIYTNGFMRSISFGAELPDLSPLMHRRELGVEDEEFLFYSLAHGFKLSPEVEECWVAILTAVPNSKLFVKPAVRHVASNAYLLAAEQRFRGFMKKAGIRQDRLIYRTDWIAIRDVPRLAAIGDAYLDPFYYTGASSIMDALIHDLPVVVMEGKAQRGRQAASIMRGLGFDELVATTVKEYVDISAKLATDKTYFQDLRRRLHQARMESSLFDKKAFNKEFASFLHRLYQDNLS